MYFPAYHWFDGQRVLRPPVRVTPPDELPVTLEAAKAHLYVDHTDDDTLIEALLAAATDHLDGYSGILGRCLVEQIWRQDFDGFCGELRLPFPDVSEAAVEFDTTGGVATPYADALLRSDHLGTLVEAPPTASWPAATGYPASVRVTFTAGYGTAADVPAGIKQAILLLVGHWYANREASVLGATVADLPMAVRALLTPFNRVGV